MKTLDTVPDHPTAADAVAKIKASGIYACLSGCPSRGFQILVRESQESAAREALAKGKE